MGAVRCVAGVLIGGKSTRFGRPKALEPLPSGKTVIAHVLSVVEACADALCIDDVVLLGKGQTYDLPPEIASHTQLADCAKGAGPLAGLHSLLTHAGDRWALMLACDLPLIQETLLHPLFSIPSQEDLPDVVAYQTDLKRRPFFTCCALYHPRILPRVDQALDAGDYRLQSILRAVATKAIQPSPEQRRMLQDINTPEDKNRLFAE
ncbi:MAG: molybdenum cofactor guanylyltransferase [Planctomycetes bacterium]|nr:molybdenum cofactor guanylyltransferase [Planctomycetota bacterium]